MFLHLVRKELLEHLMSLRFAIACVLCLVVILCSVFVRTQDYVQVLEDYRLDEQASRGRLQSVSPWQILWGGRYYVPAYLAPNPMKVFVRGVESQNGQAVNVTVTEPFRPGHTGLVNPATVLFPTMDLVSFVGIILSLIAVVFGYDAVCGEKERGTLRLMLSYSVPRHTVLLAKWVGGGIMLLRPVLLTGLAGSVLAITQREMSLSGEQWVRLAAVAGLGALYITAIFTMAMYVSTLTRNSATSVMLLLSGWVVLVLIVPNVAPHVARMIAPVSPAGDGERARLAKEREVIEKGRSREQAIKTKTIAAMVLAGSNEQKRMQAQINAQIEMMDYTLELYDELYDAWDRIAAPQRREMDRQIALTRWIARASPFACFAYASSEIADAGASHRRRYYDQLRGYQEDLLQYGHDEAVRILRRNLEGETTARRTAGAGPDGKPVPAFRYVSPAAREYLEMAAVDTGILAVLTVLFFLLTYLTFLRYDVR